MNGIALCIGDDVISNIVISELVAVTCPHLEAQGSHLTGTDAIEMLEPSAVRLVMVVRPGGLSQDILSDIAVLRDQAGCPLGVAIVGLEPFEREQLAIEQLRADFVVPRNHSSAGIAANLTRLGLG